MCTATRLLLGSMVIWHASDVLACEPLYTVGDTSTHDASATAVALKFTKDSQPFGWPNGPHAACDQVMAVGPDGVVRGVGGGAAGTAKPSAGVAMERRCGARQWSKCWLLAELAVVLGVVRALHLLGLGAQQRLLGLLPPHQHVGLAVLGRVLGQLLGNVLDL